MTVEKEAAMMRRKGLRRRKPVDVTHLPGVGDALRALHDAKRMLAERRAKALLSIEEPDKEPESRTPDAQ
jgi:hypothetical protein